MPTSSTWGPGPLAGRALSARDFPCIVRARSRLIEGLAVAGQFTMLRSLVDQLVASETNFATSGATSLVTETASKGRLSHRANDQGFSVALKSIEPARC